MAKIFFPPTASAVDPKNLGALAEAHGHDIDAVNALAADIAENAGGKATGLSDSAVRKIYARYNRSPAARQAPVEQPQAGRPQTRPNAADAGGSAIPEAVVTALDPVAIYARYNATKAVGIE